MNSGSLIRQSTAPSLLLLLDGHAREQSRRRRAVRGRAGRQGQRRLRNEQLGHRITRPGKRALAILHIIHPELCKLRVIPVEEQGLVLVLLHALLQLLLHSLLVNPPYVVSQLVRRGGGLRDGQRRSGVKGVPGGRHDAASWPCAVGGGKERRSRMRSKGEEGLLLLSRLFEKRKQFFY